MSVVDLPLLEDDLDAPGIIEPSQVIEPIDMPSCVVLCFFSDVLTTLASRADVRRITALAAAHGEHPVYEMPWHGQRLAVVHPGVGAPLAAAFLEEVIALGARTVVAVGGAGTLVPELVMGHAVVVDSAVRDEGTSFHYLAASRIVGADRPGVEALREVLTGGEVPFVTGRTWTTDAFYREARPRVQRRIAEGCLTVEMEASALIAVARYRKVRYAHLLYAGDSLAGTEWDHRGWATAEIFRDGMFGLAADACLTLDNHR
jgi:uridine phosphorylase